MSADTEHGLTSVAAPLSKQELWHADDDKPPLRSGDDDDLMIHSILYRRAFKNPRFLMRDDNLWKDTMPATAQIGGS